MIPIPCLNGILARNPWSGGYSESLFYLVRGVPDYQRRKRLVVLSLLEKNLGHVRDVLKVDGRAESGTWAKETTAGIRLDLVDEVFIYRGDGVLGHGPEALEGCAVRLRKNGLKEFLLSIENIPSWGDCR